MPKTAKYVEKLPHRARHFFSVLCRRFNALIYMSLVLASRYDNSLIRTSLESALSPHGQQISVGAIENKEMLVARVAGGAIAA